MTKTPKQAKDWGIVGLTLAIIIALLVGGFFFITSFWQSSIIIGCGILLIFVSSILKKNTNMLFAVGLGIIVLGVLPLTGISPDVFYPIFISLLAVGLLSVFLMPQLKPKQTTTGFVSLVGTFFVMWIILMTTGGTLMLTGFDAVGGQPVTLDLWAWIDNTGRGLHVFCLDCGTGDSDILGLILVGIGLTGAVAVTLYAISKWR